MLKFVLKSIEGEKNKMTKNELVRNLVKMNLDRKPTLIDEQECGTTYCYNLGHGWVNIYYDAEGICSDYSFGYNCYGYREAWLTDTFDDTEATDDFINGVEIGTLKWVIRALNGDSYESLIDAPMSIKQHLLTFAPESRWKNWVKNVVKDFRRE